MTDDLMENLHVVLCRAESGGNVGAVCRAMASMGASSLILADCGDFDEVQVRMYSLAAYPLYVNARRYATLQEALSSLPYAAAFTRRVGRWRKESMDIREWAPVTAARLSAPLGIVFGNERDGLSDLELGCCDEAIHIPSSSRFPSLNLSHAVQLALWEVRRAASTLPQVSSPKKQPASREEYRAVAQAANERLLSAGFFKISGKKENEDFLREVCSRAGLSSSELERFVKLFMKLAAMESPEAFSRRSP